MRIELPHSLSPTNNHLLVGEKWGVELMRDENLFCYHTICNRNFQYILLHNRNSLRILSDCLEARPSFDKFRKYKLGIHWKIRGVFYEISIQIDKFQF